MKNIFNKIVGFFQWMFSQNALAFLLLAFIGGAIYLAIPTSNFVIGLVVLLVVVVGGSYLYDKDMFKGFWGKKKD